MNLHNLYLQEQHSELFKIWSGIIKVGNMGKSLLMKSSPRSYFKTNVIVCVYLCVGGSGVNLGNSYVRLSNHMTISHDHLTWPSHMTISHTDVVLSNPGGGGQRQLSQPNNAECFFQIIRKTTCTQRPLFCYPLCVH